MVWDRIADRKIREAMSKGKFDHVARDGAVNLDDYFKMPEELRMAYSILKNAGLVPEEVEMLREIDRIETELTAATDEKQREELRAALVNARLRLDVALERARLSAKQGD